MALSPSSTPPPSTKTMLHGKVEERAWTMSRPVAPLTSAQISASISRIKDLTDVVFSSRRFPPVIGGQGPRCGKRVSCGEKGVPRIERGGVTKRRGGNEPRREGRERRTGRTTRTRDSRNIISSLNVTRPGRPVRSIDRDVGPAVSLRRSAVMRNSNSNIEMSGPVTFGSSYQPPHRRSKSGPLLSQLIAKDPWSDGIPVFSTYRLPPLPPIQAVVRF